jgi:hypothetical protein
MRRAGALLSLAAALMASCSPVARIAAGSNEIRQEARALIQHGQEIQDAETVDRATRIDSLAGEIHVNLAGVQDKHSELLSTLRWWGIALAIVAVLLILWQSGAFTAIRIAIGWLPRKKVAAAELAADMLDPSRPEKEREMVAALRAQDGEFDAAFRKAQQQRKAKT